MKLKILVGTVTNTAEYVAQAIQMDCADVVDPIEVQMMDGLDIHVFDAPPDGAVPADTLYLICSSTYGTGDVPDNAQALYASLSAEPRYLGHVRYGVISLGDRGSHPQTFAEGGKRFDERLADLGAQRVGELLCLDASAGTEPETEAIAWTRSWLAQALNGTPVAEKSAP